METGKMINRISNRLRRRSKKAQETIGIGLRPSTATEVLKSLEDAGLIVRIPDETDGRFKKIVFTQKAEEIRSALREEIEESEEILLRGISPEEQECFMRITAKMLENLEEED